MRAWSLLPHLRRMLSVGPYGGELPVALRAAASVAVPLLVLWATGHLEWSLYATFGAFTSLFGRTVPLRARLRSQVQAGGVLAASVLLGTLLSVLSGAAPGTGWVVVPVAAGWATVVAVLSHRLRWHPPGPLFPVFALGACSAVPITLDQMPVALAITAAAATFALLLTVCTARFEHVGPLADGLRPPPGPQWTLSHYVLRYGLGVAAAGAIAIAVGHPYWAMVAAVVPMAAPDAAGRLTRAGERLAGTLIGVLIAWVLLTLDPPPLVVIAVAALLQAGAELYVARSYTVALLFITPLALSMNQLARPVPVGTLVGDRALDTLVGVAVAVAITLLTHERRQDATG